MKRKLCNVLFLMIGPVYGMDEFLAIPPGALEIRGEAAYARYTGFYDRGGEHFSYEDFGLGDFKPAERRFAAQVKYGLAPGLDIEGSWSGSFTNEDAGDNQGLLPPTLGIKYAPPELGAGVFVDVAFPFAPGDFSEDLETAFQVGALLRKQTNNLRFTAIALYATDIDFEEAAIGFSASPEILVRPNVGLLLEIARLVYIEPAYAANTVLAPGIFIEINPKTVFQGGMSFPIAGNNASSGWAVSMSLSHRLRQ